MYSSRGDNIFLTQIKVIEEKQSGNNTNAVLNDINDLHIESAKIMYFDLRAMFLEIVPIKMKF